MSVGGLGLGRDVLLDGLSGATYCQQDEGVGEEDDGAWQSIAEQEEADDVRHGRRFVVGSMPVDAAGCAVRPRPIASPMCQGAKSKHRGVAPHSSHQEAGVRRGEFVTWSQGRMEMMRFYPSLIRRH